MRPPRPPDPVAAAPRPPEMRAAPPAEHWWSCVWPTCRDRLDQIAVFDGKAPGRGWVTLLALVGHMCGVHAQSGHVPGRRGKRARCECGWVAETDGETLAELREQWEGHVLALPDRER